MTHKQQAWSGDPDVRCVYPPCLSRSCTDSQTELGVAKQMQCNACGFFWSSDGKGRDTKGNSWKKDPKKGWILSR